jgi:hypothetical protein
MPDIKNSNIFHISLTYFEKIKKRIYPLFRYAKSKKI